MSPSADGYSYLHSLEQEVAILRAQVTALTAGPDHIGHTKREIAQNASAAVASFRQDYPSSTPGSSTPYGSTSGTSGLSVGIPIDPSLTNEQEAPLRSPWDSSPRRGSVDQFALAPTADTLHGRSGSFSAGTPATSLTRLVHDAALGTGHASNPHAGPNQPRSNASGSEKGSTTDSPIGATQGIELPERTASAAGDHNQQHAPQLATLASALMMNSTSQRSNHTNSPHSSSHSKPKRNFAIPPLPPQPAVERLVAAYVDFVGVTAPIIHIPTLGKQLIKIREGGPDVEESDVFIVMMMLGE